MILYWPLQPYEATAILACGLHEARLGLVLTDTQAIVTNVTATTVTDILVPTVRITLSQKCELE